MLLGGAPGILLGLAFLLIMTGLVDAVMRSHFSLLDEGWHGGFLEWLFPIVRERRDAVETKTPGLVESLETLLWNGVENLANSKRRPRQTRASRLPPIVERELRIALRKQRPVRRRLRWAAASIGAAWGFGHTLTILVVGGAIILLAVAFFAFRSSRVA